MAQHSLKQRIQKDKLLQHSYYCIEEPMQSGGETGHDSRDFNTFLEGQIRQDEEDEEEEKKACVQLCCDRTILIGIQIVPINHQCGAKQSHVAE